MAVRTGSYTGFPRGAAAAFAPESGLAGRGGALAAESAASESARATSYWKNARPIE